MFTQRRASVLAGFAAAMLLLTAAFHATGLDSATRLAHQAGGQLAVVVPMLWVAFSIDLTALGLVAAIVARRPAWGHRPILLVLAVPPLAAAAMQVRFLGFILPTAVLLLDVGLLVAAAFSVRRPAEPPVLGP